MEGLIVLTKAQYASLDSLYDSCWRNIGHERYGNKRAQRRLYETLTEYGFGVSEDWDSLSLEAARILERVIVE